jgi:NtrC-family two-component system sensor histidine kinase KinB
MKAYRLSMNLKLGLISFAVLIAVASLWYTARLVDRLKARETTVVELWAAALEQIPKAQQTGANTPYPSDLKEIESILDGLSQLPGIGATASPRDFERYKTALEWAQSQPTSQDLTFIQDAILIPDLVGGIPAILVDSLGQPLSWWNTGSEAATFAELSEAEAAVQREHLVAQIQEMALIHEPIPIVVTFPGTADYPPIRFVQYLYYGESELVDGLRNFPYVQLLFVSLFVLVGYFGFSYVRKSEQSSLWVGMAKEAAHQLGTPISSLMGWLEYMRMRDGQKNESDHDETYLEIEKDIERLSRVAGRFSDIGSLPKLELQPVGPVIENTTDYMRRRLPQGGGSFIRLNVVAEPGLEAPLNAELFEWVIENLLKNALDAMESERGRIDVLASKVEDRIRIDVRDTGKGIDRRNWKNIFRPGFSTKKRGWGLGLSLAKRIVEDYHGGTLNLVQSKPGQGSTFRIEIPD